MVDAHHDRRRDEGLLRRFTRLAAFNVLSNLTVPLAGLLDTAFLGHLEEIRHLAGVALGTVLFDYVYWTFGFLRMGTTGLTAQASGRGDRDEVVLVALRGAALALAVASALLLLQVPLGDVGFAILRGAPEVEAAGRAYWDARIWGAPATLLNYVLIGWFLGREQGGRVLVLASVANGANALLDWLFIVRLDMGAAGAGAATAASQALAALVGVALAAPAFRGAHPLLRRVFDRRALHAMVALNRDIFIRTFMLISTFAAFTNLSSALGTTVLAANAVIQRVITLAAYVVDGLAFATESVAGASYAEQRYAMVARTLRLAITSGVVVGLAVAALFVAFPGPLFGLLTNHPEVLQRIERLAPWLLPVLAAGSASYILDGYFIGLTRGPDLRRAMITSALVGFAPAAAAAWFLRSNHVLWLALLLFTVARVVTLARRIPATLRRPA
ncbi:MAG: MATE family efflux transporter [Myxococcota bacterium]